MPTISTANEFGGHASLCLPYELELRIETAAGIAAGGRSPINSDYFGYLNSGAAFSASLVVFIDASHLLFLLS